MSPTSADRHALRDLERLLPGAVWTDAAARLVYSHDASHIELGRPLAVVLPRTAAQMATVVRWCSEHGKAIVPRGTGTGLSGGAVPADGQVVVGTGRLNHSDPVQENSVTIRTEAGVLNDEVSRRTRSVGLHFAPDPSSQSAASIGGNIAANAGGPHCLRHGVTLHHLRRLEWIDAAGDRWTTGRGLAAERGIDLTALLCGSEGTLGLITAADLNLVPNPDTAVTMAAFFPELDRATRSVVQLLGAGLMPVAVEMVDRAMLEAVEAAFSFGFPTDVDAAMILEFAGGAAGTAEDAQRARTLLQAGGAREIRVAADEAERAELWKCRKKAFGAVGRLAPSYVTMDVVVPLGELPSLVREIQEIRGRYGVDIATAFHAGDGNLHPGVHYDDRNADLCAAAHSAADEILRAALARGGSISGEHGIGLEKLHAAPWQLDAVALEIMWKLKDALDPFGRLNPGKALPARDSVSEAVGPAQPQEVRFEWDSMTVTAPADVPLVQLQDAALERGLWIPLGLPTGAETAGERVDHLVARPAPLAASTARDFVLECWAQLGDERLLHAGAPVVKNVAGYHLAQLLCGAGGSLAALRGVTFRLKPAPSHVLEMRGRLAARASDSRALDAPLKMLARRDPVGGGACVVAETTEGGTEIRILVPGRDRPWDLHEQRDNLRTELAIAGWSEDSAQISRLSSCRDLSRALPGWIGDAVSWNLLAADLRLPNALLPERLPSRWIWQSSPRLLYTPEAIEPPLGWHLDACLRDDRPTELPPPAETVPVAYLRAIRDAFDPAGRRSAPAWLTEADHG